eukprot:scaffold20884_cov150-Skeletonema_dohrnii-CCMP3373.AAC.10
MRMSSSRSSNIKATASSQSAGSRRAAEVKSKHVNIETEKVVVAADERVFPYSQARADSNPTQFSYDYDDGMQMHLRLHLRMWLPRQSCTFTSTLPNAKTQSSNTALPTNSDEKTTRTTTTTTQTQVASTQQKQKADINTSHATHRSSDVTITHQIQIQPFNDDELMYLADIFEKDSPSQDDELRSILSLDQECNNYNTTRLNKRSSDMQDLGKDRNKSDTEC